MIFLLKKFNLHPDDSRELLRCLIWEVPVQAAEG